MERLFRARIVDGALRPFDVPAWEEALRTWPHSILWVALQDEKRVRTNAQNAYWWGVVLPVIGQCWQHQKQWPAPPATATVHDALMRAVFGVMDTPVGPARRSSRELTVEEFTQLIDWTRTYAWETYRVRIPEANEAVL